MHGIVRYLCPYQSRSQYPHQCTSQSQRLRRWRPQHCLCCHHPALCCRLLPQVGKALMQSQSQHKYRIQSEAFACASNARQLASCSMHAFRAENVRPRPGVPNSGGVSAVLPPAPAPATTLPAAAPVPAPVPAPVLAPPTPAPAAVVPAPAPTLPPPSPVFPPPSPVLPPPVAAPVAPNPPPVALAPSLAPALAAPPPVLISPSPGPLVLPVSPAPVPPAAAPVPTPAPTPPVSPLSLRRWRGPWQ